MQAVDPSVVTAGRLRALGRAAAWELTVGLRLVRAEHRAWTARADALADPVARAEMRATLDAKRTLLDGAGLFWTLADTRDVRLLRALVAFQILANHHDQTGERVAAGLPRSGPDMTSFPEVVDVGRAPRSYAGAEVLRALVATCHAGWAALPRYAEVLDLVVLEVRRARSLDLENTTRPQDRPALLHAHAIRELARNPDLTWFEASAGASSMLTVIALLAASARPGATRADLVATVEAYTMVATLSSLLDNYIDEDEDRAGGHHNYLNYYDARTEAVGRIGELMTLTLRRAAELPEADRHLVIICSMFAMYLTTDGARAHDPQEVRRLVHAGGSLTRLLVPVLAAWRVGARQRGA
jgi:tetraprenyl-beta-curcumene synthase